MIFFSVKTFQHICISLDLNFNGSLTNDIVSFEQLGPGFELKHKPYLHQWISPNSRMEESINSWMKG